MEYFKEEGIILQKEKKKGYILLRILSENGLKWANISSSNVKKQGILIELFIKGLFDFERVNDYLKIISISFEETLLENINYEKLLIANFWSLIIIKSYNNGSSFKLLEIALKSLSLLKTDSTLTSLNLITCLYLINNITSEIFTLKCSECQKTYSKLFYMISNINIEYVCPNCRNFKNDNYLDRESILFLLKIKRLKYADSLYEALNLKDNSKIRNFLRKIILIFFNTNTIKPVYL